MSFLDTTSGGSFVFSDIDGIDPWPPKSSEMGGRPTSRLNGSTELLLYTLNKGVSLQLSFYIIPLYQKVNPNDHQFSCDIRYTLTCKYFLDDVRPGIPSYLLLNLRCPVQKDNGSGSSIYFLSENILLHCPRGHFPSYPMTPLDIPQVLWPWVPPVSSWRTSFTVD